MGYTVAKKLRVLKALETMGGNVKQACKAEKIQRSVYYLWSKDTEKLLIQEADPDNDIEEVYMTFKDAALEIKEGYKDDVESLMQKQILEGNTTMIIFYAKTQMKSRGYTERIEFEDVNEFEDKFKDKSPEEVRAALMEIANKMASVVD